MIIKSFEIAKINKNQSNIILIYGENEGLKNNISENFIKNKDNLFKYDEKEILDNKNEFIESIYSKSLFEDNKNVIIKRATYKILKTLHDILEKKIDDINLIINSNNLEKKSKLRSFFEKDKKLICIPVYSDNLQTMTKLAYDFFKDRNISISQSNINLVVTKCNGDRGILSNELNKIENYCINGKKLNEEIIQKLINLSQDHSMSELVDNCLAKNKKKIINIFNENNFDNNDCIVIIRTLLNKSKRLLALAKEYRKNKNIDLTIASAKPPIFWKDKEITKQQLSEWKPENIQKLIYRIIEIELSIKKNLNNSLNITTDFIIHQSS